MMRALTAILFIVSDLCGAELQLGFYPGRSEGDQPTADVIFEIERKADRTIWHDKNKKFDLGIGKVTEGSLSSIKLTFSEIKSFLERERHKDLIVVWFDKTVMWNEQEVITERSREVVKQMKDVGYKRVVILGAHAIGVHYVADTSLNIDPTEPDGADQPATAPESKSEGNEKAKPASEARPQ